MTFSEFCSMMEEYERDRRKKTILNEEVATMNGYYTGKISSIDKQNGKVKVTFPQENDVVSSWLPLLFI